MIRRTAGVAVLGTVAVALVGLSLIGTSQGVTPPGEHATAWSPPRPSEVRLDCVKGMTFAPAPPANAHDIVPAATGDAGTDAAESSGTGDAPLPALTFTTLDALAVVMTEEARTGFPELVAGLVQYRVDERHEAEATIVGTLAGRRVVLAPAVRTADGAWMWRDARPVLNPNGVWVSQGTMIACNEVFDRV